MPTYNPATLAKGQGAGSQDAIQAKLIYVCQLLLGDPTASSDEEKWYTEVKTNGLCAGWAAMHRVYGESMEDAWNVLKGWAAPSPLAAGDPADDELAKLKKTLGSCSREYFSGAPDAAALKGMLVDAFRAHKAENPKSGYMDVPASILNKRAYPTPPKVAKPSEALAATKWGPEVKKRLANAAKPSKYLCVSLQKSKKDVHDMSVRFTSAKMVVLEPETSGPILCGNEAEVVAALQKGFDYMKADTATIFGP
jgi:hypothetical protein